MTIPGVGGLDSQQTVFCKPKSPFTPNYTEKKYRADIAFHLQAAQFIEKFIVLSGYGMNNLCLRLPRESTQNVPPASMFSRNLKNPSSLKIC